VINSQRGVVEGLTVRSIRLRDIAGSVHTITFGAVTSITNMTKDFSYYVFKIGVAYRENTDEVAALLREIDEELRADPQFGPNIIEPIDILGIDEFADSAVIISARTKTLPSKQWNIGREFNRRLKLKFDERGIEIPFPHRTIYFGEDKSGTGPPAHLLLRREGTPPGGGQVALRDSCG
jgi:moderate conductance mechanosensitive channel